MFWNLTEMTSVQHNEYTEYQWNVHFKVAHVMSCELHPSLKKETEV